MVIGGFTVVRKLTLNRLAKLASVAVLSVSYKQLTDMQLSDTDAIETISEEGIESTIEENVVGTPIYIYIN